ncbi:uncharacterized protein LOC126617745 isoform X2 [Malus sylvestris]|uniref:uncharacterized protein LOC126617745 isoform X2 n=1 Tax=Malus sylvestris TaxID=3752 RepID=UPI0021ACEFFD|nr:uncharacterized protein LOC126617745 isoform X2 [Malus sylvestris]
MMVSANTARFGVLVKFPGRGVSSKLFVLELQPKFRLYLNAEKFEKLSTRKCLQWLPSLTSTTESLFAFPLSPVEYAICQLIFGMRKRLHYIHTMQYDRAIFAKPKARMGTNMESMPKSHICSEWS